jgi:hypothetical protein
MYLCINELVRLIILATPLNFALTSREPQLLAPNLSTSLLSFDLCVTIALTATHALATPRARHLSLASGLTRIARLTYAATLVLLARHRSDSDDSNGAQQDCRWRISRVLVRTLTRFFCSLHACGPRMYVAHVLICRLVMFTMSVAFRPFLSHDHSSRELRSWPSNLLSSSTFACHIRLVPYRRS